MANVALPPVPDAARMNSLISLTDMSPLVSGNSPSLVLFAQWDEMAYLSDISSNILDENGPLSSRLFCQSRRFRSLSAASRLHRLPKSTLSHKIRQLEDEFGIELFVREGHQLHVTDAGAEFLRYARLIQSNCEDAATAMAEMRQEVAGTLRVGSTGEFGTTITSELLYAFRQQYPQVNLDVVFLSSRQPFSDVTEQALDGIFHWGEPSDVDYISRRPRSRPTVSLPAPTTSPGTVRRLPLTIWLAIAAWSFDSRHGCNPGT